MADRNEKKGRYRKVEVRTWGDDKFRRLSRIPPSGKGLWLFLITGPHTSAIPGLFRAGRAGMAEELDWSLEAFDQAFAEALREGMAEADWEAKVVWLPNALKHNEPESPNVVTSWGKEWDLVPECDLKVKAYKSMRSMLYDKGEAFGKAFDKAFPKPSWKPSLKAMANQEQEQEQEKEKPPISPQEKNGTDLLGDPPPAKKTHGKRPKREGMTFTAWIESLPEGAMAIKADDSVFTYADNARIPRPFLRLAWLAFEAAMTDRKIVKKDWPAHFRNAVKNDWYKLWRFNQAGECYLTTAGKQLEANSQETA